MRLQTVQGRGVSSYTANEGESVLPLYSEDRGQAYRCPGDSGTISAAIHFARLKSGWHACTECIWNDDLPAQQLHPTDAIQVRQKAGQEIRRTAFGVRGAYLNAIDRFRAAQLAAIFARHLVNSELQAVSENSAAKETPTAVSARQEIAIGYDGRIGSPDIFAGVVSAVLQNGCDVVDVGRCTAASLLFAARSESGFAGCLLVTGAGGQSGDVGIDVFASDGRSIAIPWQEFGVGIRTASKHARSDAESQQPDLAANKHSGKSENVWEHLENIRRPASPNREPDASSITRPSNVIRDAEQNATVILPPLSRSGRLFRSGRSSGELTTFASEAAYEGWLERWWPNRFNGTVLFRVADDIVGQRLTSVAERNSISLLLRQVSDTFHEQDNSGRLPLTFDVGEDDRFLTVTSRRGRQLSPESLATWINKATRTSASHVTAHASQDGQRLLLVDVASPQTGRSHEVISDSLAIAGFLLTLINTNGNSFPT